MAAKNQSTSGKQAEDNLSKSDLIKILDNSYDEIFVINGQGIVVYVNDACERHYGLKPQDVIGRSVYSLAQNGYYKPLLAPVVFAEKRRVTMEQETQLGKKLVVTATPVFDENNEIEFVVMNSRDISAVEALKHDLLETKKMVERYRREIHELRKETINLEGYVAYSKEMRKCLDLAKRIAGVDSTVLITGESGTGKNILAKYIHKMSNRKNGPLMSINCAAIPEQLLESELFGYCRGAFTGADPHGKTGLVESADKGTLFLDEIGEVPLGIQAKLLELVQENKFIPIGDKKHKKVDIRIIAATNRNLVELVKEGKFRQDLFYRINVIDINLPPLRERQEDIIPLLHLFLSRFDKKYNRSHCYSQEVVDCLTNYTWPGNVRELENFVERLVVTVPETKIMLEHLPEGVKKVFEKPAVENQKLSQIEQYLFNKEREKDLILELYEKMQSTYKVADLLKISQSKVARVVRNAEKKRIS